MIFIKAILLFIVIIFTSYRVGLIVSKKLRMPDYIDIFMYGFIATAGILQILYVPLILLHVNFSIVFYLTIAVIIALIALSYKVCSRKIEKNIRGYNKSIFKKLEKASKKVIIVLGIIVLAQAITSSVLYNENADDSFYVSLIEQNKDSNAIYTIDPSTGEENTTFLSRYMVSGYELSMSVVSKLFGIPATILTHTVMPFIMIIFAYLAYYILANKLFDRKRAKVFLLFLSIVFMFTGFTTKFRGVLLLSRIWQGKEIFLNIVLTMILSDLIALRKDNEKQKLVTLGILNFSAVFFTNSAIFLVPFTFMAFMIIELVKRNIKHALKMVLSLIPIAIYAVIYLLVAQNVKGSTFTEVNLWDVVKDYFGKGFYYILYMISIVIILIKGNSRAKKNFIFVPLIYLLTIYNPLFTNLIVNYCTGSEVFWRLFWLLPVELSIVYGFMLVLCTKKKDSDKIKIFVIEVLLLVLAGNLVYSKANGFIPAENMNKIPKMVVDQTQFILDNSKTTDSNEEQKKIVVLAPPKTLHNETMRQLSSKINLIWSRDHYMYEMFSPEDINDRQKLREIYEDKAPSIGQTEFNELREKYGINWIIMDEDNTKTIEFLNNTSPKNKTDMYGYMMYQY